MEPKNNTKQLETTKPKWLKLYSIVLIANALYIVAFYLLMKVL